MTIQQAIDDMVNEADLFLRREPSANQNKMRASAESYRELLSNAGRARALVGRNSDKWHWCQYCGIKIFGTPKEREVKTNSRRAEADSLADAIMIITEDRLQKDTAYYFDYKYFLDRALRGCREATPDAFSSDGKRSGVHHDCATCGAQLIRYARDKSA